MDQYIAVLMLLPLLTFFIGVVYGDFKAEKKKQ